MNIEAIRGFSKFKFGRHICQFFLPNFPKLPHAVTNYDITLIKNLGNQLLLISSDIYYFFANFCKSVTLTLEYEKNVNMVGTENFYNECG